MATRRRRKPVPLQLEPAEALVVELLYRAEEGRASASELMRGVFAENRLEPRKQKRVRDLFHQALHHERLVDLAVEEGTPGGLVPALEKAVRVMMTRVLVGELSPTAAKRRLEWVDWQAVADLRQKVREVEDPVGRAALQGSIPDWLARRIVRDFGDDADAVVRSLLQKAPTTLRANTLRGSVEALIAALEDEGVTAEPTRYASAGVQVTSPAQLFRTRAFREGLFEMQDEASQLVAELVAPSRGSLVLDVCAGAGGKTLALAALMENRGSLWAADSDSRRLADLQKRARRAGVHNMQSTRVPEDHWPEDFEARARRADRILIDAPCSGVGSLRRNPDMRRRTTEDELSRLGAIQRDLLRRAAAVLKPRARVVYATCTILREENQEPVEELLAADSGLEPVPVVEILGGERGRALCPGGSPFMLTTPHRLGMDGFFAAVLRRK